MSELPVMQPVSSSNVESVGYSPDSRELFVKFKNNSTYKYLDVPESVYTSMITDGSVGGYLAKNIKPNYTVERVA